MGKNKAGEHIMTCSCHFSVGKLEYVSRDDYDKLESQLSEANETIDRLRGELKEEIACTKKWMRHCDEFESKLHALESLKAENELLKEHSKSLIEVFKVADASLMGREITMKIMHDSMKFVREEITALEEALAKCARGEKA